MKNLVRTHFESVASTNTWAKEHIDDFEEGTFQVITASKQSGGRGRDGRQFISPVGGMYLTCAFEMPLSSKQAAPLALAVGGEIAKALGLQLKWPNDFVSDTKKLGGILIEAKSGWWIVGIGINVTTPLDQLSEVKEVRPASLLTIGKKCTVEEVTGVVIEAVVKTKEQYLLEGFKPFYETTESVMCFSKGEAIAIRIGRGEKEQAIYRGLDPRGELCVFISSEEGKLTEKRLSQAEVFFE